MQILHCEDCQFHMLALQFLKHECVENIRILKHEIVFYKFPANFLNLQEYIDVDSEVATTENVSVKTITMSMAKLWYP